MTDLHKPQLYLNPASNDIVIFIHGFMGSPRQFESLAQAVHRQGYSAASLLLPGHGGPARDFGLGTFKRWQHHVDTEIERFSGEYTNIWLAGHSMGGLLAINSAVRFSGHVRGLFTIACPFKLTAFSAYALKTRIRQVFCRKGDPVKAAYLSNSSVVPSPGLIWHSRKPAAELKKLMLAARSNLPQVRVPVVAVYSAADELTSIISLDIFRAELTEVCLKPVLLTESLHAYYTAQEQAAIEQELLQLVMEGAYDEKAP